VIFVDGACEPKNPRGVATYGFVIYREEKQLAVGSGLAAEPWTEQASNNVAEYVALIMALEKVLSLRLEASEVEVRADSKLLVEQVNGTYAVRAPRLKPLHERVKRLLPQFKNLYLRWIQREENAEADALSKEAYTSYIRSS
jgi:ribonuclease HI